MAGRNVIIVRAVVDQYLPIDELEPFHRVQRLHADVPPTEHGVEIPARIAQIGLEARRVLGPSREDDPRIGLDAGLDHTVGRLIERAVIGLRLPGECSRGRRRCGVSPAVTTAHEALGVAVVSAHDAVAAMAAHVEERVQPALPVAGQDDGVFAHVGVEEIVGPGHQALARDHQPGGARRSSPSPRRTSPARRCGG
jgi:hypothetical protein